MHFSVKIWIIITWMRRKKVWLSKSGKKFHNKNNCGTMDSSKAFQVTIEQAVDMGMEACDKCY